MNASFANFTHILGFSLLLSLSALSFNSSDLSPETRQETLISAGSSWSYIDSGTPASQWNSFDFDHSHWDRGTALFGFGFNNQSSSLQTGQTSYYFRKTIQVDKLEEMQSVTLFLRRDDGAIVYINGKEVLRDNLPKGKVTGKTKALKKVEGIAEFIYYPFSIDIADFEEGTNTVAVEIHQAGKKSDDLCFDLSLICSIATKDSDGDGISDYRDHFPKLASEQVDSDDDGLGDQWELDHFGNLSSSPTDDHDQDGLSNLNEFCADTDPKDKLSQLGILIAAPPKDQPYKITLKHTKTTRKYTLFYSLELGSRAEWKVVPEHLLFHGDNQTTTLNIPGFEMQNIFFRAEAALP